MSQEFMALFELDDDMYKITEPDEKFKKGSLWRYNGEEYKYLLEITGISRLRSKAPSSRRSTIIAKAIELASAHTNSSPTDFNIVEYKGTINESLIRKYIQGEKEY